MRVPTALVSKSSNGIAAARSCDDGVGPNLAQQGEDALAVPDVEFVMDKSSPKSFGEATLVPSGVALRPEEHSPLVVIHAVDFPAKLREVDADFGADEAGRAGDQEFHRKKLKEESVGSQRHSVSVAPLDRKSR